MHKLILLIFTLLSFPGLAQNNNQLSFGFLYFDYEEFDTTGFSLNHETGFIPGFGFLLNKEQHSLELRIHAGTVHYDGYTQTFIPVQTDTEETLFKIGYRFSSPSSAEILETNYYIGAAYHYWLRDIQPTNNVYGLEEIYTWFIAEAGIQSILFSRDKYQLSFDLGLLYMLNGNISINLESYGFGSPDLKLGNEPGFRGKLKLQTSISPTENIEFGIEHTYFEFGRSNNAILYNGFQAINIVEPRSESRHTFFYIGLNQLF